MIDKTKLQIGDKVSIEGTITAIYDSGIGADLAAGHCGPKNELYFYFHQIKTHTPRPIEVGCTVKSCNNKDFTYVVLALNKDTAWIQINNVYPTEPKGYLIELYKLTRVA